MGKDVVLLGFWPSMFVARVRVALAEKGVEYDYKEEDRKNKSDLLLRMNPIHKLMPVLIHNGKPVIESLVILEYIDEIWPGKTPLMPLDPYERAQARFWADYVDKKVYHAGRSFFAIKGNVGEKAKEFIETLEILEEKALENKPYFNGDSFGFMDIALVAYYRWFCTYEEVGNFKVEDSCPKLSTWAKRCMQRDSVAKALPDSKKMFEFVQELQKQYGLK